MSQEREEVPATPSSNGEVDLSVSPDEQAAQAASGGQRSLVDDIEDLVVDAKTYLDAELSYQKTRASFVGESLKRTIAFGVIAAIVALFAAIGLTMGLIIALTPLITAWGATGVVVGVMLLAIFLLLRAAGKAWKDMMSAIHEDDEPET